MFARAWNAAVALIEGRTDLVANILREADLTYDEHGAVQQRLKASLRRSQVDHTCKAIRDALVESLSLHAGARTGGERASYYEGIRDVEDILEGVLTSLEGSTSTQGVSGYKICS